MDIEQMTRDELLAIVSDLPKTADGVPVIPGSNKRPVWKLATHTRNGAKAGQAEPNMNWNGWGATFFSDMEEDGYVPCFFPGQCYSSREAAEASSPAR